MFLVKLRLYSLKFYDFFFVALCLFCFLWPYDFILKVSNFFVVNVALKRLRRRSANIIYMCIYIVGTFFIQNLLKFVCANISETQIERSTVSQTWKGLLPSVICALSAPHQYFISYYHGPFDGCMWMKRAEKNPASWSLWNMKWRKNGLQHTAFRTKSQVFFLYVAVLRSDSTSSTRCKN